MQNIPNSVTPSWTEVPYVETTDKVRGGLGGVANASAVALTERTNYLNTFSQNSINSPSRPLLNKLRDELSVKDFGAVGNGSANDTTAIINAFTYAALTGLTCVVPTGTYNIHSSIVISVVSSIKIECDPGVVFKVVSSFPVDTQVFVFVGHASGEHRFVWQGGEIDGRLLPVKVNPAAPDLLSVSGESIRDVLIDGVIFRQNTALISNRGDSCLFLSEGQNYTISSCTFIGAVDAAIYMSGNAAQTTGRKAHIVGNTFQQCNVAYISKRSFEDQIISNNFIVECDYGIIVGGEADGTLLPGKKAIISNNVLKKTLLGIDARIADGTVIVGNRLEDFGVNTSLVAVPGIGIRIAGSSNCVVIGNYLGTLSFVPANGTTGITISNHVYNAITYVSDGNLIADNVVVESPRGIYEEVGAGSDNTITGGNKYISCTAPVVIQGIGSLSGNKIIGITPLVEFQIPNAAVDQKTWRIQAQETQLSLTSRNDDNTLGGIVIGANREAGSITQLFTSLSGVPNHLDDAAALVGGVPVGGFYRNGSVLMIRAV